MKYEVPAYRLEKLTKLIKRAQNKGGNISFNVLDAFDKKLKIIVNDDATRTAYSVPIIAKFYNVEIDGEYKINCWQFVATLEHNDNGNIIRCINSEFENKIPSKYLTSGCYCEHCHTIRDRKDTYLIYNENDNEFKQVGKTCLLDYTNGLTPETCSAFANVFNYCASINDGIDNDDIFSSLTSNSPDLGFYNNSVKKIAYSIVKRFGYIKESTSRQISEVLMGDKYIEPASDEEIEKVDEFAQSITDEYDYMRNAKLAWLNSRASYRDFALIGSFVSVYLKNLARLEKEAKARKTTNYVGNIGDKIIVDVASYRVLYTKTLQVSYYNTSVSYVYEIIDTNGNTYIWSSSKELGEGIKQIVGTIKDHKEYKGTKQTIITRCKVTE